MEAQSAARWQRQGEVQMGRQLSANMSFLKDSVSGSKLQISWICVHIQSALMWSFMCQNRGNCKVENVISPNHKDQNSPLKLIQNSVNHFSWLSNTVTQGGEGFTKHPEALGAKNPLYCRVQFLLKSISHLKKNISHTLVGYLREW